jgi:hypothetical protein
MKAISYFKVDSGIRDYLLSLLVADRDLYQCKYDAQLRGFMKARNLDSFISDVGTTCAGIPDPSGGGALGQLITPPVGTASSAGTVAQANGVSSGTDASTTPVAPSSGGDGKKSSNKLLGCGTVAPSSAPRGGTLALLLLGIAPAIVVAGRRRKRGG